MKHTFLFSQMMAEDVQAAELRQADSRKRRKSDRKVPYMTRKEAYAEKIWERMKEEGKVA